MTYFRELPNLNYQSFLKERNNSTDYIQVKNLFRRAKLRDDLSYIFTSLNSYYIRDPFLRQKVKIKDEIIRLGVTKIYAKNK